MMHDSIYRNVVAALDATSVRDTHGGQTCIVVIGIDRYRTWSRLHNAVSDANGVLQVFSRLGFEHVGQPLFDEMATGDALRRLVTDDLTALGDNDSLVLFFAGHGHTLVRNYYGDAIVKDGYIIPVDGDRPGGRASTWLRLESWLSEVTRIPAKHILVLLDACHSGLALGPVIQWRSRGVEAGPREAFEQLRARRSRRIITSALDDQLAMDSGPVPGHSLFTGCLIEGLTSGLLAKTGRSTVTGSEIAQYVQRRVTEYPQSMQTPDFGALALDDRGELLVRVAMAPLDAGMHTDVASAVQELTGVGEPQADVPSTGSRKLVSPDSVEPLVDVSSSAPSSPKRDTLGQPRSAKLIPTPQVPAHERTSEKSRTIEKREMRNIGGARRRRIHYIQRLAAVVVFVAAPSLLLLRCSFLWRHSEMGPHDALVHPSLPINGEGERHGADAGPDVHELAAAIERENPFLDVEGVRVQAHQVTRREYAIYLATLTPRKRAEATPRRAWEETAPDEPVGWTCFEQATAFCAAIGAHLPTFPEWERASRGKWGLDPTGGRRGPLREWTSEIVEGWIRIAGATATMTARQQDDALKNELLFGSAANFEGRPAPDESDVSSKEVGIRCVRN